MEMKNFSSFEFDSIASYMEKISPLVWHGDFYYRHIYIILVFTMMQAGKF
jgi:hypothetical protein